MRKTRTPIHNGSGKKRGRFFATVAGLLLLQGVSSYGQSATWSASPASTEWTYAGNWSPMSVPNSMSAAVIFGTTTIPTPTLNPSIDPAIEVGSIAFLAHAPAYTITAGTELDFWGPGITNNSGIIQSLVTPVNGSGQGGFIAFFNGATAGSMTSFTNAGSANAAYAGGHVGFYNNSSAGNGVFNNNGGTVSGAYGGLTVFNNNATAGNGVFNNNGGAVNGAHGGYTAFTNNASAGNGTFFNNGGAVSGAYGGFIDFSGPSTAGMGVFTNNGGPVSGASGGYTEFDSFSTTGNATLIANAGAGGGQGGHILFYGYVAAGAAHVELFGNGYMDISGLTASSLATGSLGSLTVGSIEGSGNVFLGANNLTVGSNNLSTTFSGVIQDGGQNGGVGGSLTKMGAGILALSGTNTYTGGTTISGGLINFNSLANFGTGMVTVNGGGLQWAAGSSTDISGRLTAIGSGGATFDTNGNTVTLASPLTGAGGLTKAGLGLLDLTGASTYTGATVVSAGSLRVDGSIVSPTVTVNTGALVGGHGTIGGNLVDSGVVSPGNSPGTLIVKGNYTQNSSGALLIEVAGLAPGQHDLLKVGGSAMLGGALLLQPLNGFKFTAPGQEVTFLTAASGVTGKFSTVQNLSSFNGSILTNTTVIYLPNAVEIESSESSIYKTLAGVPGLTGNDLQTAKMLDSALSDPRTAGLLKVLSQANLGQLIKDVELIDPGQLAALSNIGSSLSLQTINSLTQRFETLQGLPITAGPGGPAGPDGKGGKDVAPPPANNRWGTFITGSGDFERVDDTPASRGFNMDAGGVTFGIDYRFTDHLVAGLFGSYTNTGIDIANGGRINVNTGKWGLYGTYFDGGFYVNSALEGGYSAYNNHRNALGGTVRSSTDGGDVTALFAPGYNWTKGGLTFGPTSRFQYTYQGTDGFTESGSLAPMNVASQHTESIVTAIGMKASYDWKIGTMVIRPELRLEWEHEYGDTVTGIDAQLASGAGRGVAFTTPQIGRDDLHLGAGCAVVFSERVSAYIYYDGEFFRTNYSASAVSGGFRVSF